MIGSWTLTSLTKNLNTYTCLGHMQRWKSNLNRWLVLKSTCDKQTPFYIFHELHIYHRANFVMPTVMFVFTKIECMANRKFENDNNCCVKISCFLLSALLRTPSESIELLEKHPKTTWDLQSLVDTLEALSSPHW